MSLIKPIILSGYGITLVPLGLQHEPGLKAAAADGELWHLRVASVPEPSQTRQYIETAQAGRCAFAVIDASGAVLGSTSYYHVLPEVKRLEIGYTWYAKRAQRTYVNTACKLLLLSHAFDVLQFNMVGWRTDAINFSSQAAIERLGAQKDGIIRGDKLRRDGTIRDTVVYSLSKQEWPAVRERLEERLTERA